MNGPRVVLDGLGFPESTRWHDGRLWLCNWGSGEVLAVTPDGEPKVVARLAPRTIPFSIDWLPDGRLLVVDGPRRLLLRQQAPGGSLEVAADLAGFGAAPLNEIVVDGAGNAYVNAASGVVVLVRPSGSVEPVAEGLRWPNGMALLDDGQTLVVADSHAEQLIGYDVREDATLSGPPHLGRARQGSRRHLRRRRRSGLGRRAFRGVAASGCGRAGRSSTRSAWTAAASPAPSAARTAGPCSSPLRNGAAWRRP